MGVPANEHQFILVMAVTYWSSLILGVGCTCFFVQLIRAYKSYCGEDCTTRSNCMPRQVVENKAVQITIEPFDKSKTSVVHVV